MPRTSSGYSSRAQRRKATTRPGLCSRLELGRGCRSLRRSVEWMWTLEQSLRDQVGSYGSLGSLAASQACIGEKPSGQARPARGSVSLTGKSRHQLELRKITAERGRRHCIHLQDSHRHESNYRVVAAGLLWPPRSAEYYPSN